jgi:hypothetical protein
MKNKNACETEESSLQIFRERKNELRFKNKKKLNFFSYYFTGY